jgi:hypothetical protein
VGPQAGRKHLFNINNPKLARLRKNTLLSIKCIGRKYAEIIFQWQTRACFAHDAEWVGPMIIEYAHRVLELLAGGQPQSDRRVAPRVTRNERGDSPTG